MVKKKGKISKYLIEVEDINGISSFHADDYGLSDEGDFLTIKVGRKSINFPTVGIVFWSVQDNLEKADPVRLPAKGRSAPTVRRKKLKSSSSDQKPPKADPSGVIIKLNKSDRDG